MSIDLDHLQDQVTSTVAGLRDRTADAVRADGGSVFRELHRLGRRIDDAEEVLSERIVALGEDLEDRIDDAARDARRTSWPRRLFWLLLGAAAGAGALYLLDPDRGPERRAELKHAAEVQAERAVERVSATEPVSDAEPAQDVPIPD